MEFVLTDELINQIISAIENQEQLFVLDSVVSELVAVKQTSISNEQNLNISSDSETSKNQISQITSEEIDENRYYSLPEWKPADGFAIRENFVSNLHSPLAHEELQEVLHSGRGVFKNFRNVLKKYPEIDKRWHIYKHSIMSAQINDWYNSLREIWGLEKLDQLAESEESIVYDDFSFENYDSLSNDAKNEILFNINAAFLEKNTDIPDEIKSVVFKFALKQFQELDSNNQTGILCHSLSEDFAGCITASQLLNNQENVMVLTSLFVPEHFQGLGIATELISMLLSKSQETGKKWILFPDTITPELLEPLLTRMGFRKIRYGYIAEIQ